MGTSTDDGVAGERLERDTELQRLARLLRLAPTDLTYLSALPSADLRTLRDQITANLFESSGAFAAVAAVTRVLPVSLSTSFAQKFFGPLLVARIGALLEPERAVQMVAHFPDDFLADVGVDLDPRRVAPLLALVPAATVARVAAILIAREEWLTMGSFVGQLPKESIRESLALTDPVALLRIALVLDDKSQLPEVLELAGPEKVGALRGVAEEHGLSEQTAGLAEWLSPEQRVALGL